MRGLKRTKIYKELGEQQYDPFQFFNKPLEKGHKQSEKPLYSGSDPTTHQNIFAQ